MLWTPETIINRDTPSGNNTPTSPPWLDALRQDHEVDEYADASCCHNGSVFTPETRGLILRRDHYTCQCEECVGLTYDLVRAPRSILSSAPNGGWMITIAHWPDFHGNPDDDPTHARVLCTACHVIEEFRRGNWWGAAALYARLSQRADRWKRTNGKHGHMIPYAELREIAWGLGDIPSIHRRSING